MKIFFFIILITSLSSCGFKVVNNFKLSNFHIIDIETIGEKKINFDLKNKLSISSNNSSENKIQIVLDTKKTRSIKEKNSKNQITKYLININVKVKIKVNDNEIKNFSFSNQKDYNVSAQKFQTINAERSTIRILTNSISSKIIKELSLINPNDL